MSTIQINKPRGPFSSKYDWAWKTLERNASLDEFALFSLYADDDALIDMLGSLSVSELVEIVSDYQESEG